MKANVNEKGRIALKINKRPTTCIVIVKYYQNRKSKYFLVSYLSVVNKVCGAFQIAPLSRSHRRL